MIKLTVPVQKRDHVMGAPDAPVTVVQYGDYESPECRTLQRAIEKMIRPLLKKVRLVYRHFPIVRVHPHALRAAEAAEAAAAQGMFWEMHTLLFLDREGLRDNDLYTYAKRIGLNLEKFDAEMARGVHVRQILKDRDLSRVHGISSAPTLFINDRLWAMRELDLLDAVKDIAERSTAQRDNQEHYAP